ncbi:hypothetical protein ACOJBO_08125 [Rhizobium beringeri]
MDNIKWLKRMALAAVLLIIGNQQTILLLEFRHPNVSKAAFKLVRAAAEAFGSLSC